MNVAKYFSIYNVSQLQPTRPSPASSPGPRQCYGAETHIPETNHAGLMLFNYYGTPQGWHFNHGYGCQTKWRSLGAVEKGEEIERTAHVLVTDPKQADPDKLGFDPFDVTKVWPRSQFPMKDFGRLAAFSPSSMVPGIEDSPDPLLQFRVFFYRDAQYRSIGVNLHPTASLTSSDLVSLRRRIRSATTSLAGEGSVDEDYE
ncbi:catalase [Fusarium proliferatum]|nr:catalase [Fusarium proliferatum]